MSEQPIDHAPDRESAIRPRKTRRYIVFLGALTALNAIAVILLGDLLADVSSHNRDGSGLVAVSLVAGLVGLVGLAGAWADRSWGPRLYLGAVVADRVIALIAAPEQFPPLSLLGVALAIALLSMAEKNR